jgi:uncharacterized protein (TIGR03437 family)
MLLHRCVPQLSRIVKLYSFLLVLALGAQGQSYVFTKVLNNNTQRPDGNGVFNINNLTMPAFDGQWVVFKDYGNKDDGSLQALWSFNTADATFHKLADLRTTVPGTTTTFTDIQLPDTAPLVRKGTVIFVAHYISGALRQGLFSVPAAGGPIVKIADYSTADPTGGTFNRLGASGSQAGGFSFDGATVVFAGQGSTSTNGAYSALSNGTSLALVADSAHPFTGGGVAVGSFSTPTVGANNVLMYGTDGTDPATGYNGLYLAMVGGNGTPTELVNSKQPLPGDPNAAFHTRFDAPVMALDGMLAVFRADNSNAGATAPLYGLYTADLASHAVGKIADVNSTLTGLGKLSVIATSGVAANQGSVLFKAGDTAGANALYLWSGGSASRIVGSGDTLDGQSVVNVRDPGNGSLYGQGFAFNVDFGSLLTQSLYVAVPASTSTKLAAVMNSGSYASASIAPGEVVTLFGTGIGPATLAYYQLDANQRIGTQLAGVQVAFNGYPAPLIYVSDKQSAAVVPFELAGASSAQVVLQYSGRPASTVTVQVANTMPGLFAASQAGSGLGAIQNSDQSYNSAANPAGPGSQIVLWIAGLGPLAPSQPNGSFVGTPLPSLQFPVTVNIGGLPAQVVYSGPAPTAVAGLYQVNCVIPLATPSGNAAVTVTADGRSSQPNLILAVK